MNKNNIVAEPAVLAVADILESEFPDEPYWSLVVIAQRILVSLDKRRSAVIPNTKGK